MSNNNETNDTLKAESNSNYRLIYEYKKLSELLIRGLYVIPSFNSMFEWHCVLFIRNRIYRSAIIKFIVIIPDDFPKTIPTVKFTTNIFHPLISTEGDIDLSHQFPDWASEKYMIAHILCYIKSIFHNPDKYNHPPLNFEASTLMKTNPEAYMKRVSEDIKNSITNVYDNTENSSIQFTEQSQWENKEEWENTKKQILKKDAGFINQFSDKIKGLLNI
ncbi:hypothetical protein DLAC_02285 [Tieghemostelium lacteum]|uniref:UBC core domain-containing protein n=1 Tax=Tieghemostelium lacteum TaxID=361077 RepID=A0A152A4L6_TIELA|nr:hypothetical protein DLAC_02285 [Tieghemostelium lacteum]|eukprot:KYR01176.1 hypothetical protein DLAC_02285 [Tieghemostelium lacteum]